MDLVLDARLEVTILADGTVYTFRDPPPTRQEHWKFERQIGSGSFGVVKLEKCTSGTPDVSFKAVKQVKKTMGKKSIDFTRELEIITRFSQKEVSISVVEHRDDT
jgi:serine/threonine protein kinase